MQQASEMNSSGRLSTVRGFLLDMDGTFYLSDRLLEGALRFIELLREQGKQFLFLTNNSSSDRRQYAEKISRLGLPLAEEAVLTEFIFERWGTDQKNIGSRMLFSQIDSGSLPRR